MKSIELKHKTSEELTATLNELKTKLAKFGFQLGANTLKDTSQIKKIKKDVARILTFINKMNRT